LLVRLVIFAISVSLIVWLLPHENRYRYEFTVGGTWLNDDYYAPFPLAILKSPEEIARETNEIIRSSKPVYLSDESLPELLKSKLPNSLNEYLAENHLQVPDEDIRKIKSLGEHWLDSIYRRGIIQEIPGLALPELIVEMKMGNAHEKLSIDYFTKQEALQFIALQLSKSPSFHSPALGLFFENFLQANVVFDEQLSESARRRLINSISRTRGMINKGEFIIEKGERITPEKFRILESVRAEYEARPGNIQSLALLTIGQTLVISVLLGMVLLFLILLRKDLFADAIKLSFLFILIVGMIFIATMTSRFTEVSIYVIPFCILPIIIRAFFDTRLALFAHLITMMIIGLFVPNPFEFIVIQVIGGMTCIFSVVNLRKRSRLFLTIGLLMLAYLATYTGLTLMAGESLGGERSEQIIWFAASASLTLFSYPIIYLIEKVFGFTSDVSLLELSDTNNPLLKELAFKAPGTFQHSLQVANLAEAAIYKIGGNSLLTRTGALYHDIGKMEIARYFIENQVTGVNPHDELDLDESARIIISHVKLGIQMGRKYKLPDPILDFIRTHHGTGRVQYFYYSFLKHYPGAEVDENAFRYGGPRPHSRETAVVMMADAVEATSRSLKTIDSEAIDSMVERVINEQIADNQFVNADITFKDVTAIKKIFKKMLMNIFHVRVEYPR